MMMFLSALLSLTAVSCGDEPDCSGSARPLMVCKFYTKDLQTGAIKEIGLKTITVKEAKTDSVIINNQTSAKDILLPLSYAKTTTELVLFYENDQQDTLIVHHTNQPYFLSMDCGYQVKQKIDTIKYTRHMMDSVSIINKEIYANGQENIQLFYH